MIILTINNIDYRVYDSWSEISVRKARELYSIAQEIPEDLAYIYNEQSKGEDADKDQIRLYTDKLIQSELDVFYIKILKVLSYESIDSNNIADVIDKTNIEDVRVCYENLLMPFVFGVLHYPIDGVHDLKSFSIMGETYYRPEEKEVMNLVRPFDNEDAAVFCDASDVDINSKKSKSKYDYAELIIAIVYRQKGEKYTEKRAFEVAWNFKDIITCDVYHSAIYQLSKVNSILKELFPNLYQKGDVKSSAASNESGLSDFGWLNSIMTVAEMGVLNQEGLTPLESVRQTELYDFMTVLSNLRANSDFKRIYSQKNK